MAEDSELWDVICDGPFAPTKNLGDPSVAISMTRKEFSDADRKAIEKKFHAKKILILSVQPSSLESKVNVITKAKDFQELTIDELVGNLKTYKMKKKKDSERREPKKEKNLVLKTENNKSSGEDGDMAYLTRRFQKMIFHQGFPSPKARSYKNNSDKAAKRNLFPDRRFNRKYDADNIVRQALATWGDSSSESGEDYEPGNNSMMAVESESTEYDSIFALMAQSDDEVNFLDVQRDLKSYSPKKLISLSNMLIDTYHSLINDRDVLPVELEEVEQSRDDLLIVVADLRESIENLKKQRNVLKKSIENVEQERDDLLVVVMDLKETIRKPTMESSAENYQKGKEVASESHIKLENELKLVKFSLCAELEKNK
ncbi:uncharacterized protein [Nicotiana sylvestris]|uniref:uncharacterized protein n=1 Tax=Nicotiana sylvestris TaxID=4096 RepID=UPI00388C3D90